MLSRGAVSVKSSSCHDDFRILASIIRWLDKVCSCHFRSSFPYVHHEMATPSGRSSVVTPLFSGDATAVNPGCSSRSLRISSSPGASVRWNVVILPSSALVATTSGLWRSASTSGRALWLTAACSGLETPSWVIFLSVCGRSNWQFLNDRRL